MELRDLNILNWVLYEGKPCRVWCIDWQYRLVRCHSNGQEWNCDPDELQPMPLTEEMLRANGFKEISLTIGNYALSLREEGVFSISTTLWGGAFEGRMEMEVLGKSLGEYTRVMKKCMYVHELQEALYCVGLKSVADNLKVKR